MYAESGVRLRPAQQRDAPAVARLITELGHPLTEAEADNRLAFIDRSPEDELVVAELHGEVVGLIAYRLLESVERVEPYGWIMTMAVAAEHKRRGIGTRLLAHFEGRMKEQGIRHLRVTSALHRKDEAHRFYQARGYEISGVRFRKELSSQ
ncbi:MAG TPA: GNAT family N-acetyltransferase [Armatimonadota bacterium]|nr:GNAT family N-acetyltransferase [Armatimonadota bacterium]